MMTVQARLAVLLLLCYSAELEGAPQPAAKNVLEERPQCVTSSRLLKLGESIEFHLSVPAGVELGDLVVFPCYQQRMDAGHDILVGDDLDWLDTLSSETIKPALVHGRASVQYTPTEPGGYLARWRSAGEVFYRYFAVIEDDWIVLRFSTFGGLEQAPPLNWKPMCGSISRSCAGAPI